MASYHATLYYIISYRIIPRHVTSHRISPDLGVRVSCLVCHAASGERDRRHCRKRQLGPCGAWLAIDITVIIKPPQGQPANPIQQFPFYFFKLP